MNILKLIISAVTVTSLCLLLLILNYTSPSVNGPFGILAVFVFMYLLIFGVMSFVFYFCSYLINKLSIMFATRRPIDVLIFKNSCYFSAMISIAPVMLLGLQSVGVVSFYSLMLVVFFVVIGCLYISKKM